MNYFTRYMIAVLIITAVRVGYAEEAPVKPVDARVKSVTIPAGSTLFVRLSDDVTSDSKSGKRFSAELESDLAAADGTTAAETGTKVYGRVTDSKAAGRIAGQSKLTIELTDIRIDGKLVPIRSSSQALAGERNVRQAARGAGIGAVIGGAVNGGNGAGRGAAIGAAASTVKKGEKVGFNEGDLLEFNLKQSVKITLPQSSAS